MHRSSRWSLIAAGLLAACSSGGEEVATSTSTTSTSSTLSSAPPAPTTTETTRAPDSSPPASTPPSDGTAVVVSWMGVLGWWDGQSWVRYAPGTPVPVVGGETYAVVQLDAPLRTSTGTELHSSLDFSFDGNPLVDLDLGPEPAWPGAWPVAVSGVRSPVPRPVTSIAPAAYQAAAWQVAENAGLVAAGTQVVQAVRADLDGDGDDEVVVVAERHTGEWSPFESGPGDHSIVFLRTPAGDGSVRTEVLVSDVNESTPDAPSPYLVSSRVAAVADLNGDGRLEVVLAQGYYEGSLNLVLEVGTAGDAVEVLSIGLGV